MKKIIYIAGSQHSGTTLRSIILGGHSHLGDLCEILQLLERKGEGFFLSNKLEDDSSYGAKVKNFTFWGKVSTHLHTGPAGDLGQRYHIVREAFMEQFEPAPVIVDSSKSLPYLLSARTRRLNTRLVYYNETGHLWNQ